MNFSFDILEKCIQQLLCWCSQPPLLSHMVAAIYDVSYDRAFLHDAFTALEMEYKYWTGPPKQLSIRASGGPEAAIHRLSRYFADTEEPRPEGYRSVLNPTAPVKIPEHAYHLADVSQENSHAKQCQRTWSPLSLTVSQR